MQTLSLVIVIIGGLVAVVGGILFLVAAFQESILWGLGVVFVPFVALIFLIMHSDRALAPFLVQLGGAGLVVVGALIGGGFQ